MIAVEHLTAGFGTKHLFRDASFTLSGRDRAGIVGANGAGKSTLLKIIFGLEHPESGIVQTPKEFRIGYLPQEIAFDDITLNRTTLAEVMMAKPEVVKAQEGLEEVQHLISTEQDHTSARYTEALYRFGELQHMLESAGAYTLESEASRILFGLGFSERDLHRPLKEFSGGWQMRVLLAKLLLSKPNALLLDEPTNHLDLASLLWLEEFLRGYEGIVLVVSHDRTFLNSLATKIVEISHTRTIEVFTGNYDRYETQKAEREALMASKAASLEARRKEIEKFIDRFRYKATKAKQVQSKIKMVDRMERIELSEGMTFIHFDFPPAPPSGRMVFEIEDGAKSYGTTKVFSGCELRIEREDRVAFVGRNGEGKTTLGKILAGVEDFTSGSLKIGHNVTIGYYAQHVADLLDGNTTVYNTIEAIARSLFFNSPQKLQYNETQIRSLLGSFLFHGDDVLKPVRVLSGGEKSRLALAKLLLTPSNTLILDEPTNHLDMHSKEVLKQALLAFEGTVIMISHDRDFLTDLADRVITFGGGTVKEYFGPIEQYISELSDKERSEALSGNKPQQKSIAASEQQGKKQDEKQRKRLEAEQRNERHKLLKPLKNQLTAIEKDIASRETALQQIEDARYDPDYYSNADKVKVDTDRSKVLRTELDALYFKWSSLSEEIEKAEASIG